MKHKPKCKYCGKTKGVNLVLDGRKRPVYACKRCSSKYWMD